MATSVDNPILSFSSFGNRPFWGSRGNWAHSNLSTGTSGTISHNQYSAFSINVSCRSSVSFYWRTISQLDHDWLKVYVNSVCVDSISGYLPWSLITLPLDYGNNTIEWRYVKDSSISYFDDRGFVDNIIFHNATTLNPGAIIGSQTICSGGDPNNITSLINSQVYSNTAFYLWQYSLDGISSWVTIPGMVSANYNPPPGLLQDRFYRRITLDGCGNTGYSNVIKITVNDHSASTTTITACDSYQWIDGNTYTASNNTATFTMSNSVGCDSVVSLDLTINNSTIATDVVTACDSFQWIDGITYTSSNNTATFTLLNSKACDSLITLDLTIHNSNTSTDVVSACDSFIWIDGLTYIYSNNTATYTLKNIYNCDSVVSLDLQLGYSNSGTDVVTACNSYQWIDGVTYTSNNNTATYSLSNSKGCDSLVTLNLTIINSSSASSTVTACDSYLWNGNTYTVSGSYMDTIANAVACDSVMTLNLTISSSSSGTDVVTACDSYQWIDGITYTSSNNAATFTLMNLAGCDSVVTLALTINNSSSSSSTVTACDSYLWNGNTYTASGSYMDTIANAVACDSVMTLNLTINSSSSGTDVVTACDSYQWIDGIIYTSSNNTATFTLMNSLGCDSVVTLDLTINNSSSSTSTVTACDSYLWNGNTYTVSGSYMDTIANAVGCDSVMSLNLTINSSSTGTDVVTACDSYQWIDGITYTSSNNTATFTLINSLGCDSVVTLDLTIINSSSSNSTVTACDSYLWNGINYTVSGSYMDTIANAVACDSVMSLNLTINSSSSGTDVVTACDSYQWIDGITYTSSNNTATFTLMNSLGCDSVVTLDLSIDTVNYSIVNTGDSLYSVQSNANYQWVDCNNAYAIIPGATMQGFKPLQNGSYALIISNGSCLDTSSCENVIVAGIEENTRINMLEIYPNPTRESFTIVTEEIYPSEKLQIFNIRGELVKEIQLDSEKEKIDVSTMSHGVYIIRYFNNYQKLVIVE